MVIKKSIASHRRIKKKMKGVIMPSEEKLLTTLEDLVKPEYSAVVVIDMQNDFCHKDGFFGKGELDSRGYGQKPVDLNPIHEIVPNLIHLLDVARSVGTRVYIVRSFMDDHYLPPMVRLRNLRIGRSRAICVEGEWGSQQFEGFEPQPGDIVITKHVYSAFIGTNFKEILDEAKVKTLIVTGVLSNVCCESTIRDGCMLGFYIVAPRDCSASYSREDNESCFNGIEKFFGIVTTSEEIIQSWKK